MALIGTVVAVTGVAYLISQDGSKREIQVGDQVETGDTIQTPRGSEVELDLTSRRLISIYSEQTVQFTEELSGAILPSDLDSAVNLATIETVIKAIEEGKDISAVLEETAAGQTGNYISYGFNFVDIFRIDDVLNAFNFAYDYQIAQRAPESDLLDGNDITYSGLTSPAAAVVPVAVPFALPVLNSAPTASFTSTSGIEDTANATISLTGSDTDGSIAAYTVLSLPPATQGVLYLADGVTPVAANSPLTPAQATGLIFVAAPNFNGTVNMAFNATDNAGTTSSTLSAQISVASVNDTPIANADNGAVIEDTPIVGNVLTNDTDVEGSALAITQFSVDTDGDSIAEVFLAGATANIIGVGSVAIKADGSFSFNPAPNYVGTIPPIVYTVSDGVLSNTGALNLGPVSAINDAPTANLTTVIGNEDSNIAINLSGSDIDGTIAAITVTTLPLATQGVLYLADGVTPVLANSPLTPAQAAGLIFTPAPNFNGLVNIAFNATDDGGATSPTATTSITVNPQNDAPDANNDVIAASEDVITTISSATLLANDSDIDGNPLTITSVQAATNGTVSLNAGNVIFTPNTNYFGPASFTYTISDGQGGVDTATVSLNIASINDNPDAVADLVSTPVDTPVILTPLTNDTDIEGDPLTLASIGGTTVTPGTPQTIPVANGTLSISAGGVITFTPNSAFSGASIIAYSISDGAGGTDTANITVNVSANVAPQGTDATRTVLEDNSYTLLSADFGFTDADVGQTLNAVRIDALPTNGSLLLNGVAITSTMQTITLADINAGNLTFQPAANASG